MLNLNKLLRYQKYMKAIYTSSWKSYTTNPCISDFSRSIRTNVFPFNTLTCNSSIINRQFHTCISAFDEETAVVEATEGETEPAIDPRKDRTKIIPPEVSIRYMKSAAYKTTYGDEPVWVKYRRNFRGQFVPRETRKTCIRGGVITTGSPCPICRDEYLVLHYTNVDLLKQFIHPYTGEMITPRRTHVCQKKLLQLEVAIKKARFYGLLTYQVPFRKFDYKEYYPEWKE